MKTFKEAIKRGRRDPVFFSEYFCGLKPHPGQVKWLIEGLHARERTLATGNRYGKSAIAAVRRIWKTFYKIRDPKYDYLSNYVSVCLSITLDQAQIVWKNCERLFMDRPQLRWALKSEPTHKPYPLIRLGNGGEIWARSTDQSKNLWGHRWDDVNFDEPAFEKHPENVIPLIRTRLMDTNGQIDYTGTPWGRNYYYKQYLKGFEFPEEFYSQKGKTSDNPYIPREAIERTSKEEFLSAKQKLQTLDGEFVSFDDGVFDQADISAMFFPTLPFMNKKIPGHFYVDGWDIAWKKDALCGITLDISENPIRIVQYERFTNVNWEFIYAKIRERHKTFGSMVVLDITGLGQHLPNELDDIKPVGVTIGFKDGPVMKSKTGLIFRLQMALQKHGIQSPPIPKLLEELTFYEWDDKHLSTDTIFALALALLFVDYAHPKNALLGSGLLGEQSVSDMIRQTINMRLR